MCGIGGFSGSFPPQLLSRINEIQRHRGPDGCDVYHSAEEGIGLAHGRLAIIDLSAAANQPMWDARREVAIVFNGELFNYRELRAELEAGGAVFRTQSDTEVLIHLYRAAGVRMLDRLNGMFAFALWDTREKSLFVARDQLGVKPLYWTETADGFAFASELKALLAFPGIDRTIDPTALRHYLTYLWCPAPLTPVRGIRKLEAGHALLVRRGKVERSWRFYALPYDQPIVPLAAAEAEDLVRKAVREAVRRQMVADVPVGAFLSGGLDSSSVVAFAREFSPAGRLDCFTIGLDERALAAEGQPDDLPYAEEMARYLGVNLHVIRPTVDIVRRLDEMVYHLDEPLGDPAPLNVLFISELARQHGMKVLLSGAGGDDIFSGYRRHVALGTEKYWGWLPRPARRGLALASGRLPGNIAVTRRVRKAFAAAGDPARDRLVRYFHWLDQETAARLTGTAPDLGLDPLAQALDELPPGTAPLNRMLYLDSRFFLVDHNLNYSDKMGMAAGVEIRVPLLDPDLVALAARLPVALKQRGTVGKWVFRRAMRGLLPAAVIDRPKTGFGMPLRHWIRHELRESVERVMAPGSALEGHIDLGAARRLVEDDRSGAKDGAYTIFSLLTMESWLRQFARPEGRAA